MVADKKTVDVKVIQLILPLHFPIKLITIQFFFRLSQNPEVR